ncbi:hypothetical protein GQ53DRAFT_463873 [Thozetella sp. PMI_491]|nr:hypothetical protein GQ53DRAFT_463873 [Thozetella sp. PMI_491]
MAQGQLHFRASCRTLFAAYSATLNSVTIPSRRVSYSALYSMHPICSQDCVRRVLTANIGTRPILPNISQTNYPVGRLSGKARGNMGPTLRPVLRPSWVSSPPGSSACSSPLRCTLPPRVARSSRRERMPSDRASSSRKNKPIAKARKSLRGVGRPATARPRARPRARRRLPMIPRRTLQRLKLRWAPPGPCRLTCQRSPAMRAW